METLWRDEPCGSVYQGFGSRPKKQARSMWIFNLDKRMVPTSSSPGQRGCVTKAEFHRVPKLLPFIAKTYLFRVFLGFFVAAWEGYKK